MRMEIIVPTSAMPKKDPEHPCPCQFRQFQLKEKTGELMEWLVSVGAKVKKGQVLCEGEVEKKTLEFVSPCDGVLAEICIEEEEEFKSDHIKQYHQRIPSLFS